MECPHERVSSFLCLTVDLWKSTSQLQEDDRRRTILVSVCRHAIAAAAIPA